MLGGGHPMERHRCTVVVGLEGSGTRFIARELSKLLIQDCGHFPTQKKGLAAIGCNWNGETPPCWMAAPAAHSTHYIQHVSLPWGGTCVHDDWYVLQRSLMCFANPDPGRCVAHSRKPPGVVRAQTRPRRVAGGSST